MGQHLHSTPTLLVASLAVLTKCSTKQPTDGRAYLHQAEGVRQGITCCLRVRKKKEITSGAQFISSPLLFIGSGIPLYDILLLISRVDIFWTFLFSSSCLRCVSETHPDRCLLGKTYTGGVTEIKQHTSSALGEH